MNATININGTEHEITKDGFGITYVDGMLVDSFLDTLSDDDFIYCCNVGFQTALSDPAAFNDISDRHELPVHVENGIIKVDV